ncbi:MAG: hypothetical protein ACI9UT_003628 [Flavobacteriales bacterium]|jgi:hypothetical protein
MSFQQFSVCEAYGQKLVILTNTLFNEVDSILVATIQSCSEMSLIKGLQIPIMLDEEPYYVDLLDIATISKKQIKTASQEDLQFYRSEIKSGLDLLIDGF